MCQKAGTIASNSLLVNTIRISQRSGEIQKKQGYTEICINKLVMEKMVKVLLTKKWNKL